MKSKVYFMDDRYKSLPSSMPAKAMQLFDKAELGSCFESGDSVAIKCHMGEWFNTGYLRPILLRVIVDKVKELGGRPFITDTTTAPYYFYGTRSTADLYLETAARNGFTRETMGCPIIISDGMYGIDDVKIETPNGLLLKEGYLARGIADADAVIVVNHFKGHGNGVYGGAIKNVAIGCSSKRGKFNIHLCTHQTVGWNKWSFHGEKCIGEKCPNHVVCNNLCPAGALKIEKDHATYDGSKCIGCFGHQRPLFRCGLWGRERYDEWGNWFLVAMADAATGYINHIGKKRIGYLTYALDLTPACDCVPGTDRAVLPNLGVFASKDIVGIDLAALDMSVKAHGIPGSVAEEKHVMEPGQEKFTVINGMSQWISPNACDLLGAGSKDYELVTVEPSSDESAFTHPLMTPENPSGKQLGAVMKHFGGWTPPGGFKYRDSPTVSIESLSKR